MIPLDLKPSDMSRYEELNDRRRRKTEMEGERGMRVRSANGGRGGSRPYMGEYDEPVSLTRGRLFQERVEEELGTYTEEPRVM